MSVVEGQVYAGEFGTFLGKKGERLVIRTRAGSTEEVLDRVSEITVAGNGISLSSDLVRECAERGIPITFISAAGRPYAKMTSPTLTATIITRREQLLAYYDGRGVELARAFAEGKLKNQASVLRYFARHRKSSAPAVYDRIQEAVAQIHGIAERVRKTEGESVDVVRGSLMGLEGNAARVYWEVLGEVVGRRVDFGGREHQGAGDPVNSMLNYGYGMLYSRAWWALLLAGLEPFAGFLHVDRPGKPSLVLDFVEEFRPQLVDRPLFAQVGRGRVPKLEDGQLDEQTRKEIARRFHERLDERDRYEGDKVKLATIVQRQARRMAAFVRGEAPYRPYVGTW